MYRPLKHKDDRIIKFNPYHDLIGQVDIYAIVLLSVFNYFKGNQEKSFQFSLLFHLKNKTYNCVLLTLC